jgi:hypothetical protein
MGSFSTNMHHLNLSDANYDEVTQIPLIQEKHRINFKHEDF